MHLIKSEFRRARKQHTCELCKLKINKGEKYSYQYVTDGGDTWSFYSHLECNFLANELWNYILPFDDGMTDSEFEEGIHLFCKNMICPLCLSWVPKLKRCKENRLYCSNKCVEKLKEYDLCYLEDPDKYHVWAFYPKEKPLTTLPGED